MTVGRSSSPTHQKGALAEDLALEFLQQRGFSVLAQNFHTPYGELDLVLQRDALVIFVEVRQRQRRGLVSAVESVTLTKQRKIIQSAGLFLQYYPQYAACECRFDVVALTTAARFCIDTPQTPQIDWIEAAFMPSE